MPHVSSRLFIVCFSIHLTLHVALTSMFCEQPQFIARQFRRISETSFANLAELSSVTELTMCSRPAARSSRNICWAGLRRVFAFLMGTGGKITSTEHLGDVLPYFFYRNYDTRIMTWLSLHPCLLVSLII